MPAVPQSISINDEDDENIRFLMRNLGAKGKTEVIRLSLKYAAYKVKEQEGTAFWTYIKNNEINNNS